MALRLFNTLSRSVQDFVPLDPAGRQIGLYCCGPTVYDFAHIGNFRTFVFADLVRRYLQFKGFAVRHVMNITDVEDKIIKGVAETKMPLREFTEKYEAAFFDDFQSLNCLRPHETPHATDYIADIISLIEKLMARGLAYRTADGSVYFSIEKYRAGGMRYGQLVNLNFEEMRPGQRVASDEYAKEAVADFALWKARVPEDGAVFWPSPWGEGRPGWHIECSAMSMKMLGGSFDLHLGGEDLIFPHHEDEIAQSEGAGVQEAGQPFVKYWMHGAHLLAEGKKMSKSLGNFFTLRDLLEQRFHRAGNSLFAHGRPLPGIFQFHPGKLARGADGPGAPGRMPGQTARRRRRCQRFRWGRFAGEIYRRAGRRFQHFRRVGRDLRVGAREQPSFADRAKSRPAQAAAALATWERIDSVLGVGQTDSLQVPAELEALLKEREAARKARDFKRADAIRDELKAKGWTIEDTPKGARLKKL